MAQIIPAILTDDFQEFQKQLKKIGGNFPYAQLDIMDGNFVPSRSFEERPEISELTDVPPLEIHLMVNDPVEEMRRWQPIDKVIRVLLHLEAPTDIKRSISFARKEGWEIGLVLNPDTPLTAAEPFYEAIDVLQFMTVYPGKQGASFEEKVLPKIKQFTALKKRPRCAVDGGINVETIKKFKGLDVDVFNVGSALTMADDVGKAKMDLESALKKSILLC